MLTKYFKKTSELKKSPKCMQFSSHLTGRYSIKAGMYKNIYKCIPLHNSVRGVGGVIIQ